eukprot:TRINITY_DN300_c0_g1_i1.p1 TRINITY_DN300_c0_g1~~TRINITY_DN300_c0_g1_i1.p1  ORF type:complete len:334 (-),score=64.61 TRINITY_DN300_c0_g1_i1:76-1053(-)
MRTATLRLCLLGASVPVGPAVGAALKTVFMPLGKYKDIQGGGMFEQHVFNGIHRTANQLNLPILGAPRLIFPNEEQAVAKVNAVYQALGIKNVKGNIKTFKPFETPNQSELKPDVFLYLPPESLSATPYWSRAIVDVCNKLVCARGAISTPALPEWLPNSTYFIGEITISGHSYWKEKLSQIAKVVYALEAVGVPQKDLVAFLFFNSAEEDFSCAVADIKKYLEFETGLLGDLWHGNRIFLAHSIFRNVYEAVTNLETKFEKKFEEMDAKLVNMDAKFAKKFEEMDAKFEKKFEEMDAKFVKNFDNIDAKFSHLERLIIDMTLKK